MSKMLERRADDMTCARRVRVIAIFKNNDLQGKIIVHYPQALDKGRVHLTMYDWTNPTAGPKVTSDWTNVIGMDQIVEILENKKFGEVKFTTSWQQNLIDAGYQVFTLL